MTELKKRFQKLVPEHFGGMQHNLMSSCELIAEKFAIDFVRWLDTRDFDGKTYEELLEIYKNEITNP